MTKDADFDRIFNTLPPLSPRNSALPELPARRELRGSPPRKPTPGKAIVAIIAVTVLILSGTGIWLVWNEYGTRVMDYFAEDVILDFEGGGAEPAIDIVVAPGDIGETVARKLFEAGVTASFESVYSILLADSSIVFQYGTYRLLTGMSGLSAVEALREQSNRVEWRITLPEGVRLSRALEIMSESTGIPLAEFEAAADPELYGLDVPTGKLEGYLFPDTYFFQPNSSAQDIVATLVSEMQGRLDDLSVAQEDRHYVLTFAALVQREARLPEDFPKVARVFQNRIDGVRLSDHNGRLQSDATYRDDLDETYDTYTIVGLPPGPISMPGQVALEAVLNPAQGDWVYFVTVNLESGETIFTSSLAEHQTYVPQLRQWCRENAGYPGC
jgi:UPF0755 protein